MTQREKLLKRLANRASDNGWTFGEVRALLETNGYAEDRCRGSHHTFTHPGRAMNLVIPVHGNKVKPAYIKQIREELIP